MGATTSGTVSNAMVPQTTQGYQPMQTQFSPVQGNVFQQASTGLNQAMQGTQAGMAYQPMNIGSPMVSGQGYNASNVAGVSPVTSQNVQAGQIAGTNLGAYFNPYESQVVQSSLGDIDRARQMQANQLAAQATKAGAFGGSRSALMESELGRNALQQAAQTSAQLRQAGFQNAQQLAGQDIASRMQADLANQGANLQAQQLTGQFGMQAQLANQAAQNAAGQFGAGAQNAASLANQSAMMQAQQLNQAAGLQGAQQRLAAANQMGNLANLGFGMGQNIQGMQSQSGMISQAINQALIDAAKAQYAGYSGAPAQSLGYMASALGATPASSTTNQSYSPGLFDYLSLGVNAMRPTK